MDVYEGIPVTILGKRIVNLKVTDEEKFVITFDDCTLELCDCGQSCCEYRHLNTNDNLDYFVGSKFLGVEVRDAANVKDENCDIIEVQFLLIHTSGGTITVANYNEHNGYYGGFRLKANVIWIPQVVGT